MPSKSTNTVVINRSFWPFYPVIGEALLKFAEDAVREGHAVSVVLQDHADIKASLESASRGEGVCFYPAKAWTTSASGINSRIIDSMFFTFWIIRTLLCIRPEKIYVSSDPPILVPFMIMLYCRLFGASYIYHLQDIHPEAANVVIPIHRWLYRILVKMDALTMCRAESLITITKQMADEICFRSKTISPVHILSNPAISFENIDLNKPKVAGFSFCGNFGRLQRIPLMLEAIEAYFIRGGKLKFTFAGGGVYAPQLQSFANRYDLFDYCGFVDPADAAQISANFTWALLPIEDKVTKYAFPSKTSSYVMSGAKILAICGLDTNVATWVSDYNVGVVVEPEKEKLISAFFSVENNTLDIIPDCSFREKLKGTLNFNFFVSELKKIVFQ
ncbi:glycosyltransferase [Alphaproteobacteria bacterium]|nr:glycosyltransferase [Alphaproteobacteria bacterium]